MVWLCVQTCAAMAQHLATLQMQSQSVDEILREGALAAPDSSAQARHGVVQHTPKRMPLPLPPGMVWVNSRGELMSTPQPVKTSRELTERGKALLAQGQTSIQEGRQVCACSEKSFLYGRSAVAASCAGEAVMPASPAQLATGIFSNLLRQPQCQLAGGGGFVLVGTKCTLPGSAALQ
jgi:hypothetical protein